MEPDPHPSSRQRRRLPPPAPLLLGALLLVVLLWVPLSSLLRMAPMPMGPMAMQPWVQQSAQPPLVDPLERHPEMLRQGVAMQVGMHLENIHSLSLREKTYTADGRFWLAWPEELQALLEREGITPLQLLDFINQVDDWDGDLTPDQPAPVLRNGRWRQSFHFSRRFYLHRINLSRYPFNPLDLLLTLQVSPAYASLAGRPVLLLPVRDQRGLIGEYANLEGYELVSAQLRPQVRRFRTDYGLGDSVRTSQLEVVLHYRHSFWPAFIADVLPLVIVLMVVLISPYLEGSLADVRIAIPSTALLTLVFLQQNYRSELPPSPYLTYLDRLYVVSYLICVMLFVLFAWTSNIYERTPPEQREALVRRLDRYDRNFQILALSFLLIVSVETWIH